MANTKNFPDASDILFHTKDNDSNERLIFPITRYMNVMSSPKVINDINSTNGAPFLLLKDKSVEIDEDELRELCVALN
jgi:hypothetical protein